jgi:hypothetical protein
MVPSTISPTAKASLADGGRTGRALAASLSGSIDRAQASRYRTTPEPPAMASTTKATRISSGSTPSRSPSPPATPSRTRLSRLRTIGGLAGRRGTWVAVVVRLQDCR